MADPVLERAEPRGWTSCIVAATGPSMGLIANVAFQCHGQRLIAVNDAYRKFPYADVLYAGDADWWDLHQGCPTFEGEKWSSHGSGNDKAWVQEKYGVHLIAGPRQFDAPGFSLHPATIHYGNCSGFQAINLAILFGATRIILIGFDLTTPRDGTPRHFFGDHAVPAMNLSTYEYFIPAFEQAARMLRTLAPTVHIVNCSPRTALTCFPRMTLEDALDGLAVG
jgi:hypothetical protein